MSLATPYHFENLPPEMKTRDAWVTFKMFPRPGRLKPDKPPFIAGHSNIGASSTNPYTWRPFVAAQADVERGKKAGLGFCLQGSGLVGVDLDHVRDPVTGEIAEWAARLVARLDSYTEISPSGEGLHTILRGQLPPNSRHRLDLCDGSALEVWCAGRYLTMTGWLTKQWPQLNAIRDYDFSNFWPMLEDTMKAYAPFRDGTRLDVEQWLTRYGIRILSKKLEGGKTTFEIECPGTHGEYPKDDGKGFVIQFGDGALSCGCQHSSCSFSKETGNHWAELRRMHEPEATSHKNTETSRKTEASSKTESAGASKTVIDHLPDVCTLAEEKVAFLVPGLLVANNLTLVCGPPSAGKTTFGLFLADAIAQGREIPGLGRCQQGEVLYLTKENPANYIADIARRLNIKNGPGTNLYIWGDWIEEAPPAPAASHLLAWVSQSKAVVVIDSLMAFFDGNNENDSAQMRAFINQPRALLRAGSRGVLLLHHPGKVDSAQTYRGSSDLAPAIDAGYSLRNSGEGVLERLHLKLWRPRFIDQKRELLLHYRDGGFSVDERRAVVAVGESITQQLRSLLEQMPACTKKEFEDAAQSRAIPRQRARTFLDDGVDLGSIVRESGKHNKTFHTLVGASDRIQRNSRSPGTPSP